MIKAALLVVLIIFAPVVGAQDAEKDSKKTAQEIAEFYRNAVVVVETTITFDNGTQVTFGGSGFFVDHQARVRTCAHVVRLSEDEIQTNQGTLKVDGYAYWVILPHLRKKYKAEIVGWNRYTDEGLLRVLDIDSLAFKPAVIGDASQVKVGDRIYTFGNPFDDSHSLTAGVVSGLHRRFNPGLNWIEDYIQVDAAINPGNSGSPLINELGKVIGINAAKIMGADNMGYAIPINTTPVEKLLKGEVKIGYFGAEVMRDNFNRSGGFYDLKYLNAITDIDDLDTLITLANISRDQGAIVEKIKDNSPAKYAGLKRGDVIVKFNGQKVSDGMDVRRQIMNAEIGKEIEIEIKRVFGKIVGAITLKISPISQTKERRVDR